MIEPPGLVGAAFSTVSDGDLRGSLDARSRFSAALGISSKWATVTQMHGSRVRQAHGPGGLGPADGIFTLRSGLPLAVFQADCVPVVLLGEGGVGIAHGGWRGLAGGVVAAVREAMEQAGAPPLRAAIGPSIGPCCFEVGREVLKRFPGYEATTQWNSPSVDLRSVAADQLEGVDVVDVSHCTHHEGGFSHRKDGTAARQAAVVWMP